MVNVLRVGALFVVQPGSYHIDSIANNGLRHCAHVQALALFDSARLGHHELVKHASDIFRADSLHRPGFTDTCPPRHIVDRFSIFVVNRIRVTVYYQLRT